MDRTVSVPSLSFPQWCRAHRMTQHCPFVLTPLPFTTPHFPGRKTEVQRPGPSPGPMELVRVDQDLNSELILLSTVVHSPGPHNPAGGGEGDTFTVPT